MKTRSLQLYVLILGCMVAVMSMAVCAQAQDAPHGGGRGGGMGNGTPPIMGAVTAVSASDLTIRTPDGEYKVVFSVNTRFMKDRQAAKSSDVKVGDTIVAMGVVDAKAKTVAAAFVAEVNAEQVKRMQEMQANYGKTWLAGKVSAMGDAKLTLTGMDGKNASFSVDENTSLKKQGNSITLGDVKIGDQVRVQGTVKDGTFLASTVIVIEPRADGARGLGAGQPTAPQHN